MINVEETKKTIEEINKKITTANNLIKELERSNQVIQGTEQKVNSLITSFNNEVNLMQQNLAKSLEKIITSQQEFKTNNETQYNNIIKFNYELLEKIVSETKSQSEKLDNYLTLFDEQIKTLNEKLNETLEAINVEVKLALEKYNIVEKSIVKLNKEMNNQYHVLKESNDEKFKKLIIIISIIGIVNLAILIWMAFF